MRFIKINTTIIALLSLFQAQAILIPIDSLDQEESQTETKQLDASKSMDPSKNYCDVNIIDRPSKTVHLPYNLSYFISANPNGDEVGVISSGNRLVDLNQIRDGERINLNDREYEVPGAYDPVFTPDGKYVTTPLIIPEGEDEAASGTFFYEIDNLRKKQKKSKPALADEENGHGAYQSVGQVDMKKEDYIYISDPNPINSGNMPQNIMFSRIKKKGLFGKRLKVVKSGELCPGKITGSLPMISPDGQYLSYLDEFTQTTKVMHIGKNADKCDEVLDLGFPTGKVSFNFDPNQKQLAFHVTRAETKTEWFDSIKETFSSDIFVMDIDVSNTDEGIKWEAESIKRLTMTSTPKTGAYYPRFTRDGGIIAASTDITPDGAERSNLIQFTPDQIDRLDNAEIRNQKSVISLDSIQCRDLKLSAIGSLFSMVCEALPLQDELKDTVLIASSVDYNSCSNLIEDFFTDNWIQNMNVSIELKKSYSQISKEDLLAACPAVGGTVAKKREVRQIASSNENKSGHELFKESCYHCHHPGVTSKGLALFDIDGNINTENTSRYAGLNGGAVESSILSVLSHSNVSQMPPDEGDSLPRAQRVKIAQYLLDNHHSESGFSSEYTKEELQACITSYETNGSCNLY